MFVERKYQTVGGQYGDALKQIEIRIALVKQIFRIPIAKQEKDFSS